MNELNTSETPVAPVKLKGRPKGSKNKNTLRDKEHVAMRSPSNSAEHAAEHDKPRTRRRNATSASSPLDWPKEEIPEGSSYEWKRLSVVGEENHYYIAHMRQQGWEPVDPRRHPNRVPPGYDKPTIVHEGLILMERPIELTEQARAEVNSETKQKMIEAERRLGMSPKESGTETLTRQHPELNNRVVKEWGRVVPVQED
jgi:hypothetical protein